MTSEMTRIQLGLNPERLFLGPSGQNHGQEIYLGRESFLWVSLLTVVGWRTT
jgi:hypothetical protein